MVLDSGPALSAGVPAPGMGTMPGGQLAGELPSVSQEAAAGDEGSRTKPGFFSGWFGGGESTKSQVRLCVLLRLAPSWLGRGWHITSCLRPSCMLFDARSAFDQCFPCRPHHSRQTCQKQTSLPPRQCQTGFKGIPRRSDRAFGSIPDPFKCLIVSWMAGQCTVDQPIHVTSGPGHTAAHSPAIPRTIQPSQASWRPANRCWHVCRTCRSPMLEGRQDSGSSAQEAADNCLTPEQQARKMKRSASMASGTKIEVRRNAQSHRPPKHNVCRSQTHLLCA